MAVDPAAFVKWRYQQVLFSQPPWQSYRLFSSAADPCLLLTVLATDPPILQGLLLFLSLPLFLFASLFRSLFFNYMQPATTKASTDGVWSWVLMGAWESTPSCPPSSKFKATLTRTHSHSIVTLPCHQSVRPSEHLQHIFQTRKINKTIITQHCSYCHLSIFRFLLEAEIFPHTHSCTVKQI